MFKGLKSKLEDEAKKFGATATNVANQIRSGASDAGSDISGYTKKLFATTQNDMISPSGNQNMIREDNIISLDDDIDGEQQTSSALKELGDVPERVRRLSDASIESNETSISALYGSVLNTANNSKLDTISSDVESISDGGWDVPETASNDQLKGFIDNVRGRAVNYREKYRELVRKYNECVRENEKLKLVLTRTQDKTLKRIEKLREDNKKLVESLKNDDKEEKIKKLQELLERCRETITTQKSKISTLSTENKEMKESLEAAVHGDIEKINAEWKGRIDHLNDEFGKKLADCEEKTAIAIASTKAESHQMMQQKDQEIEKWINKCHKLEKESDACKIYEQQLNGLHKTIAELETEKADMVQKLSFAKQEGVKLVQEEEIKKREELVKEYEEKLSLLESRISDLIQREEDNGSTIVDDKEIVELKDKVSTLEKDLYVKNEEIQALQQMVTSTNLEKETDEDNINKLNMRIKDLESQYQKLDESYKENDKRMKENILQINELLEKISSQEVIMKQKDENIDDLVNQLSSEKRLTKKSNDELLILKEENSRIKPINVYSEKINLFLENMGVDDRIDSTFSLDELLDKFIALIDKVIKNMDNNAKEEQKSLLQDIEKLTIESNIQYEELSEKFSKLSEEYTALNELKEINDSTMGAYKQLEEETATLKNKLTTLTNENKILLEKQNQLNSEDYNKLKDEINLLNQENMLLKEDLKLSNNEKDENTALLGELKKALDIARQHAEDVIQEKDKQVKLISEIEDHLQNVESGDDLIGKLRTLLEIKEKFETRVNEFDEQTRQRDVISNELALLKESIVELKHSKDEAVNEHDTLISNLQNTLNLEDPTTITERVNELAESIERLEDVEASLQSYIKINEKLAHENSKLKAVMEHIGEYFEYKDEDELIEKIQNLIQELSSKKDMIAQVTANYNSVKDQLEFIEKEMEMYKSDTSTNNELESQLSILKEKLKSKEDEVTALQTSDNKLNELLSMFKYFIENENIFSLVNNIARTLSDKDGEICASVSLIAKKLSDEFNKTKEVVNEVDNYKKLVENYDKQKSDAETQYITLQGSHEELRVQFIQKEKFVEELHGKLGKLEKELKDEKEKSVNIIENFDKKISELDEQLVYKKDEVDKMTDKLTMLEKEKSEFNSVRESLETDISKLNDKLKSLTENVNDKEDKLNNEINQYKDILDQKNEELTYMKTEIRNLNEKILESQTILKETTEDKRKDELATENNNKKLRLVEKELREVCDKLDAKTEQAKKDCIRIQELEIQLQEALDKGKEQEFVDDSGFDAIIDQEELSSLKIEIDQLKEENTKLHIKVEELSKKNHNQNDNNIEAALEMRSVVQQTKPLSNTNGDKHFNGENAKFAEPTEAEYLRNVLYRYMTERELLGKEVVTLAKVICKVLKFSPTESSVVLQREEARTHGWIGDTVGAVFQR